MGQDKAAHDDRSARRPDTLRRLRNGRFMRFEKWIPRVDRATIDADLNTASVATNESLKYHAEMPIDLIDLPQHRCLVRSIFLPAEVELPPDDKGPARL